MGRVAISAGIATALLVTAVAVGAGGDWRLHRLHLPPPPTADALGSDQPPGPGTTGGTSPPAPPAPPGPQPSPPPAAPPPPAPPPSGVGCTIGGGASPSATGTLQDYSLSLAPTTFSAAWPLTFQGVNAGADYHAIAIKTPGGTKLCGTPVILAGGSNSFTVAGLTAGTYVIYCTVHPDLMHQSITVG